MPDDPPSLRDAWEAEARNWIAWARTPGHDSYWQFHRPLQRVTRALFDAGLVVDHLAEIPDLRDDVATRWGRLPLFLHLGAIRPAA